MALSFCLFLTSNQNYHKPASPTSTSPAVNFLTLSGAAQFVPFMCGRTSSTNLPVTSFKNLAEKSTAADKTRNFCSKYPMKITVNLAALNNEQIKFLSQLGEFQDDQTWESHCDPDESQEAADLLKNAGIDVQFGE